MNTNSEQERLELPWEAPKTPEEIEALRTNTSRAITIAMNGKDQGQMDRMFEDYSQFLADPNAPYLESLPPSFPAIRLGKRFRLRMGFCNQKDDEGDYGKGRNFLLNLYDETQPRSEAVATYTVHETSRGHFNIAHRLVDPRLQKMGIGNWIMDLIGKFVQRAADERGSTQFLEADVGQYALMKHFIKNGFSRPGFQQGDLTQLQFIQDKLNNGELKEWSPRPQGMPYLYAKETPVEERHGLKSKPEYIVKLHVEKVFAPNTEKPTA